MRRRSVLSALAMLAITGLAAGACYDWTVPTPQGSASASASSSAGTGGGGGAMNACEGMAGCGMCKECVFSSVQAAESDCFEYDTCVSSCQGFPTCKDACVKNSGNGAAARMELDADCKSACAGSPSCMP